MTQSQTGNLKKASSDPFNIFIKYLKLNREHLRQFRQYRWKEVQSAHIFNFLQFRWTDLQLAFVVMRRIRSFNKQHHPADTASNAQPAAMPR